MAFGNSGTINVNKQEELREKRKKAMFSGEIENAGNTVYPKNMIVDVPIDLIDENPDNDKIFNMNNVERLTKQIEKVGYDRACPITLFEKPDGRFEINSGHSRYRANKIAGNHTIPAVIKEDASSAEKAKSQLDSNLFNRVLTYYDYAQAINYYKNNYLIPSGYKGNVRKAICEYFSFTDTTLQRYMDFMKLIPELQVYAQIEDFPASALGQANTLSEELQHELIEKIEQTRPHNEKEKWLTSRQLSEMIDMIKRREQHKEKIEHQQALINQVKANFYDSDNTKVTKDTLVTISIENEMNDDFENVIDLYSENETKHAKQENQIETAVNISEMNEGEHVTEIPLPKAKVIPKKIKPDISTIVALIKKEVSSIVVEDYDVKDKSNTTELVKATIEELQELLKKITSI